MQKYNTSHSFEEQGEVFETKYGLPEKVKFCKFCVISNQRPNSVVEHIHTIESKKLTINFDEEGVCDACHVRDQKQDSIDWEEREQQLIELCDRYRKNDGSYDCVVPGSGGKDSFFTAHILKHKYGMHPLTVTWAPHIYTEWGWKNFQAWIHAGLDNFLFTPNGRVHRLLTRLAVENLFHPFQPFIIGQKSYAAKMAIAHKIPLVFYGEIGADYGEPKESNNEDADRTEWVCYATEDLDQVHLGGTSVADLKAYYGLTDNDVLPYMPTNPEILLKHKVEVHALGFYLKWHPQANYYYAVENGGFQASPERTVGTYSKYSSIDDRIDDFHYYTTFIKFGIGRATYDAAQEVRSGDITREEGVALIKRFDGEFPERFAEEIFSYLSLTPEQFPEASKRFKQPIMDREYFIQLVDKFRSPHLWKYEDGEWKLRHTVWAESEAQGYWS